jgi:hypothetical protein
VDLVQNDRLALVIRQGPDRAAELAELLPGNQCRERVWRFGASVAPWLRQRLAHPRADPVEALVPRDRGEPDVRSPWLAPGKHRSIRRDECLLHRVLRLDRV